VNCRVGGIHRETDFDACVCDGERMADAAAERTAPVYRTAAIWCGVSAIARARDRRSRLIAIAVVCLVILRGMEFAQ
jgi:hypothetical protein